MIKEVITIEQMMMPTFEEERPAKNLTKDVSIRIRTDPQLRDKLKTLSEKSGLSKSAVIRILIDGAKLREMPPLDYHKMTAELHAIGNNLNQIAHVANATGRIDAVGYMANVSALNAALYQIKTAVMRG